MWIATDVVLVKEVHCDDDAGVQKYHWWFDNDGGGNARSSDSVW